jgi:hypothetical protein
MVMGEEARTGVAGGYFRKASAAGGEAPKAVWPARQYRQNVIEIEPAIDLKKHYRKLRMSP